MYRITWCFLPYNQMLEMFMNITDIILLKFLIWIDLITLSCSSSKTFVHREYLWFIEFSSKIGTWCNCDICLILGDKFFCVVLNYVNRYIWTGQSLQVSHVNYEHTRQFSYSHETRSSSVKLYNYFENIILTFQHLFTIKIAWPMARVVSYLQ